MPLITEAKINTEDRNNLPDSAFGIPSKRKYPLTDKNGKLDEKHILQAVRFFNKADEADKHELAKNILKAAKELGMDYSNWDTILKYANENVVNEYSKSLVAPEEANEIIKSLTKIEYDNVDPNSWKLKSPDELIKSGKGNCHDMAWYAYNKLDEYAKRKTEKGILFFIEYKEGKNEGGQTHSVCYEIIPGGICIIECSWYGMMGTFPYYNIDEYISFVKREWTFTAGNDRLFVTEIKNISDIHQGMTLSEYVSVAMKNKEIFTEFMVDSWNLEDAKKIAMRIHDKAEADKHPLLSNQNCQLCTWCAEANFRGIDVLPRPIHSPRDLALDQTGENIVNNPIKIEMENKDKMVSTIKDAGQSRWYVHVHWKGGHGGHEFIYLNYNFEIYLMDAQQGILAHMDDPSVKGYIEDISWETSYIARMDNKEFDKEMFDKLNSMDKFVPWNPKLDIPYMKEHGMLSDDDIDDETGDLIPYEEYYLGNGDDEDGVDADYEDSDPDDCYCESLMYAEANDDSKISKMISEGWKIGGLTLDGKSYMMIQEEYDDIRLHVSLVPATKADVPNMEEWEYECMKDAYPNRIIPDEEVDKLKEELHKDAIDSVWKTRMIQYDGTTIGMLTAYKVLDDEFWFIAEIYLIPEYRGKGIARYILQQEIDQHDKLILNVYQNNKHAIELYESLGFEITQDGDGRYIMELDKTKHRKKYQPSNVFTLNDSVKASSYRSLIVGEIHNSSMIEFYNKLLSERKPEFFISEFAHEDRVLSQDDLKAALNMATDGQFKRGVPDYQDNYAIYKLAYDHGCKLIGCDLYDVKRYNRMNDEDADREAFMLKVLEEFENANFVCQLGDHHLRSIPITQEFLDFCGDTKDDRRIVSDLTVDNASPIWTHFKGSKYVAILREPNELKNELEFTNQHAIQEGYWQDIKNGVNPKSKKVWFHVSFDDKLDEKGPMVPRIPTWLEDIKKDGYTTSDGKKTHDLDEVMRDTGRYENHTTPRVCFSPSIEGALNSIINMWKLKNKDFPGKQLYVYVPEKPLSQYKHKTNKELIRDKEVFDAGTTGESWILEPVKVKFYGSIKIDKVKDNGRKHKVLIRPGFEKENDNPMDNYIGRFTYKWHWLIHPSILKQGEKYEKSEKKAQPPIEVCKDIINELKDFKYGIVKDGKLSTNNSIEDYNNYYKFMTLDEFEKYRGGICYDYVEWEESYLKDHGKTYKKYYLYADTKNNDTHTFILVKNNDGYIYLESAFKPIEGIHPVKTLQEAVDIITKAMFKMNGNNKLDSFNYYVWEYKGHPEYGSSIKQCEEYYSKGEPILEGTAINPKKGNG